MISSVKFFIVRAFNILKEITSSSSFYRFDCYSRVISTSMDFYSLELIKMQFVAMLLSFGKS